jgi:hypothetical protein
MAHVVSYGVAVTLAVAIVCYSFRAMIRCTLTQAMSPSQCGQAMHRSYVLFEAVDISVPPFLTIPSPLSLRHTSVTALPPPPRLVRVQQYLVW